MVLVKEGLRYAILKVAAEMHKEDAIGHHSAVGLNEVWFIEPSSACAWPSKRRCAGRIEWDEDLDCVLSIEAWGDPGIMKSIAEKLEDRLGSRELTVTIARSARGQLPDLRPCLDMP